jgi:hypothetical protein
MDPEQAGTSLQQMLGILRSRAPRIVWHLVLIPDIHTEPLALERQTDTPNVPI